MMPLWPFGRNVQLIDVCKFIDLFIVDHDFILSIIQWWPLRCRFFNDDIDLHPPTIMSYIGRHVHASTNKVSINGGMNVHILTEGANHRHFRTKYKSPTNKQPQNNNNTYNKTKSHTYIHLLIKKNSTIAGIECCIKGRHEHRQTFILQPVLHEQQV